MSFGPWKYNLDRDATLHAYAEAEKGGVDSCSCIPCKNFRRVREAVFPPAFLALLSELGVDPTKDGEIYYNGPLGGGRHCYAGWFHFVGELLEQSENFSPVQLTDGFSAHMLASSAPRLSSLEGLPVVQLEFQADAVPWVVDDPEPK